MLNHMSSTTIVYSSARENLDYFCKNSKNRLQYCHVVIIILYIEDQNLVTYWSINMQFIYMYSYIIWHCLHANYGGERKQA